VGAGADAFVLEAAAEASAVGGQALSVEALSPLMKRLAPLCRALGRVPPSTASRQRVRPQRGPARGRGRGGRHRTE
jgi:hypothetical protein